MVIWHYCIMYYGFFKYSCLAALEYHGFRAFVIMAPLHYGITVLWRSGFMVFRLHGLIAFGSSGLKVYGS